jgi:hypothetical protein
MLKHTLLGEPKVCEHGIPIDVEDDVVWLEVPEDDIPAM